MSMTGTLVWALGAPFGNTEEGGGAFDPATLPLTGWWRASYSGDPWVGTASAGSSGSRNLTAGVAPALDVGVSLNGYTTASGANDKFLVNGTAISTLLTATEWSMVALVRPTTITYTGSSNLYLGDGIIFDQGGYCGLAMSTVSGTPKVFVYQWDGVECIASGNVTLNSWNLIQARYDGTFIQVRTNSNTLWAIASAGNTQLVTNSLLIGATPSGQWITGQIAEVMLAPSDLGDDFDNIKLYINDRYGLSF